MLEAPLGYTQYVLSAGNHRFINYIVESPETARCLQNHAFCIRPRRKAYLVALVQQR